MNPSFTLRNKRVWVAGDRGLVGSAIVRRLAREGCEVVTAPRESVDLRRPETLERWMRDVRPEVVFLAAARVGGIYANDTRPAEFIYDNLAIQTNVVEAAQRYDVEKMLLMGSPASIRLAPRPPRGAAHRPLEPTNQWYAIAKIAGLISRAYRRQYGCDFISVMPSNLTPGRQFRPDAEPRRAGADRQGAQRQADQCLHIEVGHRRARVLCRRCRRRHGLFRKNFSTRRLSTLGPGRDADHDLVSWFATSWASRVRCASTPRGPDGIARKMVDTSYAQSSAVPRR